MERESPKERASERMVDGRGIARLSSKLSGRNTTAGFSNLSGLLPRWLSNENVPGVSAWLPFNYEYLV